MPTEFANLPEFAAPLGGAQARPLSEAEHLALLQAQIAKIPVIIRPLWKERVKRLLDLVLTLGLILYFTPFLAVIAVAIKWSSPGPVLFRQLRVGKNGVLFWCYKFRSMVPNAEELRAALEAQNEQDGPIFKIRRDPRVTAVGRLLRQYSLDELPQLLNVFKGDMSLVGPRPPLPDEVLQYQATYLGRLAVQPGLTCIWQTSGRSKLGFEAWMEMDLTYIRTWSLWLDVKLLFKSIKTVLTGDGAY